MLYKRPDSKNWKCRFTHGGREIRRSTGTDDKGRAEEFEAKLRASLYDQSRLGIKARNSWKEAVVRYLSENGYKAESTRDAEKRTLIWLDKFLGDKLLDQIDRALLDSIICAKQAEGKKPRTVNGVTNTVRAVMRKAMLEWEWIDRLPKFRILKEPTRRIRFITRAEADKLLAELPDHLRRMALFALETGVRRANVTHLRWSEIDLDRRRAWVHPDEAKSRKAIPIPLSNGAIVALREAAEDWCAGKKAKKGEERKRRELGEFVFTYRDKPVKQTGSTAWEKACARAEIKNFRWHDLRHTWASWHIQDGTPLHILQELGGWESVEMVRKYAHLSSDHLADYVAKREGFRTVLGTVENLADLEKAANP